VLLGSLHSWPVPLPRDSARLRSRWSCKLSGRSDRDGLHEAIVECLEEGDEVVFFCIAQVQMADHLVDVIRVLGHGPAGHLFGGSPRAVSGKDRLRVFIASVIEVYDASDC
jgi:hypothetical protein